METINDRLKKYLNENNINQNDFAKRMDSTQQYVSAILNNKRKIGINLIERIFDVFPNIDKCWLITGIKGNQNGNCLEELKIKDVTIRSQAERILALENELGKIKSRKQQPEKTNK